MGAAKKKPKMISMRVTDRQFEEIDRIIKIIERETGTKVTKSSIILKLMEYGYPRLKEKYPEAFGLETNKQEEKKGILALFQGKP